MVNDGSHSSSCITSYKILKSYLINEGEGNQSIFPQLLREGKSTNVLISNFDCLIFALLFCIYELLIYFCKGKEN